MVQSIFIVYRENNHKAINVSKVTSSYISGESPNVNAACVVLFTSLTSRTEIESCRNIAETNMINLDKNIFEKFTR